MKTHFVSLNQVQYQINQQIILRSVDIAIDQGQSVAVVGANGTGKSTLLKLICGIIKPTAGEIRIDNYSYTHAQQAVCLRKMLGFAPDTPALYAQDTIQSYLQFIAELKQIPKKSIAAHIEQVLELFDLTAYRSNYIYTLSKGIQQRINLAQSVIHKPQLLIMDEPINGLDAEQCGKFIQYLQKLRQQHVTIIFVSHNYSDLITLCDYMLKVEQGHIEKILLPITTTKVVKIYDHVHYTT